MIFMAINVKLLINLIHLMKGNIAVKVLLYQILAIGIIWLGIFYFYDELYDSGVIIFYIVTSWLLLLIVLLIKEIIRRRQGNVDEEE